MDNFDLRKYISNKTLLEDQPKKAPMKNKRRIHEAKSSIHKKLAEIENLGRSAALEIKMEALVKEIDSRNGRLSMIDENEDLAELMNSQKIREMKKEIKMLEKQQAKYQKLLEKEKGKDFINPGNTEEDQAKKDEIWNMLSNQIDESMNIDKDGNLIGIPNPPDTNKIKSSISKITNWCEMMVEAHPSEDPHGRGWEILPLPINDISDVVVMHGDDVFKLPESEYRNKKTKEMTIRITPDYGEVAILLWTENQSLTILNPELIGNIYEKGIISLRYKGKLIGDDFSRDINYEYGEDDYVIERNLNESLPPLPKS